MNNNIIEENSADRIDSLKFEDLNTKDQLSKLESVYGELSKKFLEEYNDDVIRGNLFISDVSFARTSDNRPIFILSIVSRDGKEFTKYYDNELNKIDISQEQIDALKILNVDTTDLQKEYDELKSLNTSPDKVSLKDLKEIDNQISATCKETGLSKDEVADAAIIQGNQPLKFDARKLGGIQSETINGNEKVSTHYTVNNAIGQQYVSYQIIKTNSGIPLIFGINQDGSAEEISSKNFEYINGSQSLTLMKSNGQARDAHVVCAFRIKSSSSIDNDQVIGICNDGTNKMSSFYARGAISAEKMVGIDVPAKSYSAGTRIRQEEIMDTKTNSDISQESDSLSHRTSSGNAFDSSKADPDEDKLLDTYAYIYGVDVDVLGEEAAENFENPENSDKDSEEVIEQTAQELADEQDSKDNNHPDGKEHDRQPGGKGHGTPWG